MFKSVKKVSKKCKKSWSSGNGSARRAVMVFISFWSILSVLEMQDGGPRWPPSAVQK